MSESKPKKNGWDDLVYNLFYPSILGSILFDFVDPLRFELVSVRSGLIAVLAAFITDYWHMKNNIRADEGSKWRYRAMDIGVTVLFMLSYYSFSYAYTKPDQIDFRADYLTYLNRGLYALVAALGVSLLYDFCRFRRYVAWFTIVSGAILAAATASIVHVRSFPLMSADHHTRWFLSLVFSFAALYLAYVGLWSWLYAKVICPGVEKGSL